MEYFYYLIFLLAIAILALVLVKFGEFLFAVLTGKNKAVSLGRGRRHSAGKSSPYTHRIQPVKRSNVAIPWGWPDHRSNASLKEKISEVTRTRETVDSPAYKRRTRKGVRFMMEDKYGRPAGKSDHASAHKTRPKGHWLPHFSAREEDLPRKPWGW